MDAGWKLLSEEAAWDVLGTPKELNSVASIGPTVITESGLVSWPTAPPMNASMVLPTSFSEMRASCLLTIKQEVI